MRDSSNPLIYLASASPRRSALLTQIGVPHRVRPVPVDERAQPGEHPDDYVQRLAATKAHDLWTALSPRERRPVLGADTTVSIDGSILGKPSDEQDCLHMLTLLSGRTHQVFTAVALCWPAGQETRLSVSDVTFRKLASDEIRAYWRSGEPADKAGAYAVQGLAALFIERISGSYSGIMGLPLFETGELLARTGWGIADAAASGAASTSRGEAHG